MMKIQSTAWLIRNKMQMCQPEKEDILGAVDCLSENTFAT